MTKDTLGATNDGGDLFERDLSRLLKAALDVQIPVLKHGEIRLPGPHVAARARTRPASPFPLWGVAASTGCLVALAALGLLAPSSPSVPRALAVAVPIANLAMAPVAALAIVRRRTMSHAR